MKLGKPTCRYCTHWENIEASVGSAAGRCVLNPPSICGEDKDYFPISEGTDFCFQFKEYFHPEVNAMNNVFHQECTHNHRHHNVMLDHKVQELDRFTC